MKYKAFYTDDNRKPFDENSDLPANQRLETETITTQDGKAVTYYYKTDEMAFKKIIDNYDNYDESKYSDGFEAYKMGRFDQAASTLNNINSKASVKEFIRNLYQGIQKDINRQTVEVQKFLDTSQASMGWKKPGTVENCLKNSWCVSGYVPYGWDGLNNYVNKQYSTKARTDFYQQLKNATNDFTESTIYDKNSDQGFKSEEELIEFIKQVIKEEKAKEQSEQKEAAAA